VQKPHSEFNPVDLIFLILVFTLSFYKITIINIFNIGVGLLYIVFAVWFLFLNFIFSPKWGGIRIYRGIMVNLIQRGLIKL